MTMTVHFRESVSKQKTLCGMSIRNLNGHSKPLVTTTAHPENVNCKRCLKMITNDQPKVVQDPEWVKVFREGVTAIVDEMKKTLSLQTRITDVVKKIARANRVHDPLVLDASEVETLATLLYLLQDKK